MHSIDPSGPLGSSLIVLAAVIVVAALRQVLVRGGWPETPREWALYLLALPGLLLGAMLGVMWWVVEWPTVRLIGFVWGSIIEGFNLGRGAE
jgi:hypothetical protein